MSTLVPDYLNVDYTTIISRIKTQLAASDTFKDFNYEGANFTILMELLAYIGEMNIYLLNKIAQNVHIETADIYEAVNRNARQMGYEPKGPVSSRGTVTVSVSGVTPNHEYQIAAYTQLESSEEYDSATIKFANTTLYSETPTGVGAFTLDMIVKQGVVTQLTGYTGGDLVDNELVLPANYAYDNDIDDDYPSLDLFINNSKWARISDFYDDLSILQDVQDVYQFVYDRYRRSKIVFNSSRNVPTADDSIRLTVLLSIGANGAVGANTITGLPTQFLYDVTGAAWVDNSLISVTNASVTTGQADAEEIDTIKSNAKSGLHAQFRNVTVSDYISNLESRSDVTVAQAWGEQDIAPSGNVNEFNKVYLSVIPTEWGRSTVHTADTWWNTDWNVSAATLTPSAYDTDWETTLKAYIAPRKMMSAYEVFSLPELVYFSFEFGVRLKRLASLVLVTADIENKLDYYFRAANQNFNSIINFNDIIEYLLDLTNVSPTDNFKNLSGIRNLNLRDMDVSAVVSELNSNNDYPQYVESSIEYTGENQLRKIQLGYNQFPMLQSSSVVINEES